MKTLSFLLKIKRNRIDAVSLATSFFRAVIEHMTKMAAAVLAEDFRTLHAETTVGTGAHILGDGGIGEGWPAATGVELCIGSE